MELPLQMCIRDSLDAAAHGFPLLPGAELGHFGILEHGEGDVSRAVMGIVPLKFKIPDIRLGIAGDLHDAGVLHGRGVVALGLPFKLPALITGVFLRNNVCKISDTNSSL